MSFIFGLLGVIVGFIIILCFLYLLIYFILKKYGFKENNIFELYKKTKEIMEEEQKKPKQVSGMTKMLLPEIQRDFKNFQLEAFYLQLEKIILSLFQSVEEQDLKYVEKTKKYHLLKEKVAYYIQNLQEENICYHFQNIQFHKHTIKEYAQKKGCASILISSSIEYDVEVITEEKKETKKVQTRLQSQFIYIIDSEKAGFDVKVLGLHCPNCGAAITSLLDSNCRYCKSEIKIQIADLAKCWKLVSVKEDKK